MSYEAMNRITPGIKLRAAQSIFQKGDIGEAINMTPYIAKEDEESKVEIAKLTNKGYGFTEALCSIAFKTDNTELQKLLDSYEPYVYGRVEENYRDPYLLDLS